MVFSTRFCRPSGMVEDLIKPMSGLKFSGLMFLLVFSVAAVTIRWMDMSAISGLFPVKGVLTNSTEASTTNASSSVEACPEYFRWIHEDLKPWKETGITREMVETGKDLADIRIVIIGGKLYFQKFKGVYQTRDTFTLWGLLQLFAYYPGRVPDLDLVFGCGDKPVVRKGVNYRSLNATIPPPAFHYCGDESSFDIVFPDWSFWGWPEINIKPWNILKEDLQQGNYKVKWSKREPYAYWKGNTHLGSGRHNLAKCNVTDKQDMNVRVYNVAWPREVKHGFKTSNLANQCTHRYKVYAEGIAWSVSEKYILACDSITLLITPKYYDFFTRNLLPMIHYWPINKDNICKSIKFAVDWGNQHAEKAQEIGKTGSKFVLDKLRMKFVYDYMLHLLTEYAKLLKYQPTIPEGAEEITTEKMLQNVMGLDEKFRRQSRIESPASSSPCTMPPPFANNSLQAFLERKMNLTKQVETLQLSAANQKGSR